MNRQGTFVLHFHKDCSTTGRALSEEYWERETGGFAHKVPAIAAKYGLTAPGVLRTVLESSTMQWITMCNCGNCIVVPVNARFEYNDYSRGVFYRDPPRLCRTCESAAESQRQAEEKAKQESRCARKKEVLDTLAPKAYEARTYLSLKPIELRTLMELAALERTAHAEEAYRKVGISKRHGDTFFAKFVDMKLIAACDHGWWIPENARSILTALKESLKTEPIINPMEKEIFRRLKFRNAIVLPHQLLRRFVPEGAARDVLAEFPGISFYSFLCMEVNFLICDEEYRPVRAIEYHGGYHAASDTKQTEKDAFKSRICAAVGVPLTVFEKSSLWRNEELAEAPLAAQAQ